MSTHSICLCRNKKNNNMWIPPLIWSYVNCIGLIKRIQNMEDTCIWYNYNNFVLFYFSQHTEKGTL